MKTAFQPFDWSRLVLGEAPYAYYAEIGLKIVIVFAVLWVVMRILGKTGRDRLSPLQQMLLIALGSSAGDVMLYHDVPLGHAVLILIGVSVLAVGLEYATTRWRAVRDAVDSRPVVLVLDGHVFVSRLHRQRINERELYSVIRENGGRSVAQVQLAILEVTGRISVFLDPQVPAGGEDLLEPLRRAARRDLENCRDEPPALTPGES